METEYKMRIKLLIYFILVVNIISAQKKKVFIENVTDFYAKTDSLPFFVYQKEELDTLLALNKTMPASTEMYGVKCEERMEFRVDRYNKIKDFRHEYTDIIIPQGIEMNDYANYDSLKVYFQRESERVIRITEGLWFSDSTRAEHKIRIIILYNNSAFNDLNSTEKNKGSIKSVKLAAPNSLLAKRDLYNYGVKKFQVKKTPLAKAYFEEAVRFFPKDIDAHYNLAACYYKLKNVEKACEHWKRCLELGDKTVEDQLIKYCK